MASEGLTNYLRRIIQDEKSSEIQPSNSYQDFSTIPQSNHYGSKTDLKGRRLSYQRAVSGEDPRYHDSLRRRHQIPENSEVRMELHSFRKIIWTGTLHFLLRYDTGQRDWYRATYLPLSFSLQRER